jgi:hypothetical protein
VIDEFVDGAYQIEEQTLNTRGVEDRRSGYHAPGHEFGTLIGPQHIQLGSQLAKY